MSAIEDRLRRLGLKAMYGHKATSEGYQAWLRGQGVQIGERVRFYSPWTIRVDIQRPWMIAIGDDVHIAADVSILQHDYSWAVLQRRTGEVLGSCGPVTIGNNVFLGQRVIVLKGTQIGDDVVVGSGSVVAGQLKPGAVFAGVPATRIMSIEDFQEKRRKRQFIEARDLVRRYVARNGIRPEKRLLREFFWLFEPDSAQLDDAFRKVHALGGNASRSARAFSTHRPLFQSYEEFIEACLIEEREH